MDSIMDITDFKEEGIMDIKDMNELEEEIDEFSSFLGKVIRIDTEGHKLPLYGRLISCSDRFLTVERADGRITVARRKVVLTVEPTKCQMQRQENLNG
jgi:hypothetical protein